MKTLKFLGIASLVVLVATFTSCSRSNDDSSSEYPTHTGGDGGGKIITTDTIFAKLIGDYSNITYRAYLYYANYNKETYLFGIKNKHLWFSKFDSLGTLKQTWEDLEKTDSVLKIDKGYGQYATFHVKSILLCPRTQYQPYYTTGYKKTDTGDITLFRLSGKWESVFDSGDVGYAIFTSNNKSKHIIISHFYNNDIFDWYGNSVFLNVGVSESSCCYSQSGDTLYVTKENAKNPTSDCVPVSYEEGITIKSYGYWPMEIYRHNFKTCEIGGKEVWITGCKAPFDIPTDAKPQYTSTLLDKSTDIWKYKVNLVYYDGTKKEFTFTININTGEYKASV